MPSGPLERAQIATFAGFLHDFSAGGRPGRGPGGGEERPILTGGLAGCPRAGRDTGRHLGRPGLRTRAARWPGRWRRRRRTRKSCPAP
jgi:hypothetical protein